MIWNRPWCDRGTTLLMLLFIVKSWRGLGLLAPQDTGSWARRPSQAKFTVMIHARHWYRLEASLVEKQFKTKSDSNPFPLAS